MAQWVWLALVFGVVFVTCLIGLAWAMRKTGPLIEPPEDPDEPGPPPEPHFGAAAPALAGMLPSTAAGRQAIHQDLLRAGYYRPTALVDFLALRALLTWVPLLAMLLLALLVEQQQTLWLLLGAALLALLGYSVPRLVLAQRGAARSRLIQRSLPLLLDSLSLCLSAGLSLVAAFRQVGLQVRRSHPVLGSELLITYQQARLHSLEHALRQFAARVQVPEVSSLASLLSQSERLGTDAAPALQELATNYRTTMRQQAEAQANRTSFYMLLPTVLCLLIASAIMLMGPGVLQFVNQGNEVLGTVNSAEAYIDQANKIYRDPPRGLPKAFPRTTQPPARPARPAPAAPAQ